MSEVNLFPVKRPWGEFVTVYSNPICTVKLLIINPGQSLSLQYHNKRNELWTPLNSGVRAVIDGKTLTLTKGVRYTVPVRVLHRLSNFRDKPVKVLEVSTGDFDEDDIVRIHDIYGREV